MQLDRFVWLLMYACTHVGYVKGNVQCMQITQIECEEREY